MATKKEEKPLLPEEIQIPIARRTISASSLMEYANGLPACPSRLPDGTILDYSAQDEGWKDVDFPERKESVEVTDSEKKDTQTGKTPSGVENKESTEMKSPHVVLNEETGKVMVSEDVHELLDLMVQTLESAGYEVEEGMELEDFIEQVAEVLETDKDLDEAHRKGLKKSHKTVADFIKSAHLAHKHEDEEGETEEGTEEPVHKHTLNVDDIQSEEDDSEDDDDEKGDDEKDAKDDKKPAFLKKKAAPKKDDDGDDDEKDGEDEKPCEDCEGEDAEEGAEEPAEESKENAFHLLTHKKTEKGYSPSWSYHKPKRGHHYTIKHAKMKHQ